MQISLANERWSRCIRWIITLPGEGIEMPGLEWLLIDDSKMFFFYVHSS